MIAAAIQVAAELADTGPQGTRRATYFTVTGQTVIVGDEYDEAGQRAHSGFDLSGHPPIATVVATLRPVTAEIDPGQFGDGPRQAFKEGGVTHGAWIPVTHDHALHGVLAVASRGRPIPDHVFELLISLGHTVELALDNALAHSEMARRATIDPLTGCTNRWGLTAAVPADTSRYVLIAADLDGLKTINDETGHDQGDRVLADFADLLRSVVRPGDTVARLGGDEFVVLLADADLDSGWSVAERLITAMNHPAHDSRLRASLGICAGEPGTSLDEVMKRADQAMYQAKRDGGKRAIQWSKLQQATTTEPTLPSPARARS